MTAGNRRTATGRTLEDVILELAGECQAKACRGACKQVKPLDQFSKRLDSADGRNHYCLVWERRVHRYEKAARRRQRPGCPADGGAVSSGPAA